MTIANIAEIPDGKTFEEEARRVLRRLSEQGACLALAPAMETAVVVRETDAGPALRTAVVARAVAEAMALNEWIARYGDGRILRYRITASGRATLKRLVAQAENGRVWEETGLDRADPFGIPDENDTKPARYSVQESPLVVLARRKDRNGRPFLTDDLLAAGERLRDDFDLGQTGPKVVVDWEAIVNGDELTGETEDGAGKARLRVANALRALGPGLGDIALRCCCMMEGLESTERDMGWSARSGKIVLRIALHRLKMHYDETADAWSPLIG